MSPNIRTVELQGHRGARGVLPENSLPGFQNAIAAGSDSLELDIAMSRDRQIIVTHDPTFNPDIVRRGDSWISERLAIKTLTVDELKSYDIGKLRPGSQYARNFPHQISIEGLRIPLLSEFLELPEISSNPHIDLDIEIKTNPLNPDLTFSPDDIADELLVVVDKARVRPRIRIRSFDWRSLRYVKQIAPDIPLAFLTSNEPGTGNLQAGPRGPSSWLGGIDIDDFGGSPADAIKHLGGAIWAPYYKDFGQSDIDRAHELGLRVIVWTVNDEASMRRLIRLGVDGITTDYPELGRRVIDDLARRT